MKKVIIRTREQELTSSMYQFGSLCARSFIRDLEDDCLYQNDHFKGIAKLSKSGTISVCVFTKDDK